MKKIFKFMPLVVIALCSMMTISCGDDDNDGDNQKNPSTTLTSSAAILFNCSDNFTDYFDVYLSVNGGAEQKITNLKTTYIAEPPKSLPATVKFTGKVVKKDGIDYENISAASVDFIVGTGTVSGVYNAATQSWSKLNTSISSHPLKFKLPTTAEKLDKYIETCTKYLNKEIVIEK